MDFAQPSVVQFGVEEKVRLCRRHLPGGQPTDQQLDAAPLFSKETSITVNGTNNPRVGVDSAAANIESVLFGGIEGSLIPFAISRSPIASVMEHEPDGRAVVSLPANISGSFGKELDEDSYRFNAKKGEQWQIDVLAERLRSTADPLLIVEQIIKAEDGTETFKRLAREENGKQNPGGNSLPTLTRDPSFLLIAPADGEYQLRLRDRYAASRGNAAMTYTVTIQKPNSGFSLVVFDSLPSPDGKVPPATGAISVRKGGTYHVPVYAYRTGGHNDDIHIVSKGLPNGIKATGGFIPAGKSSATLVLTASADAAGKTVRAFFMGVSAKDFTPESKAATVAAKVATLVHAGANGLPRTARFSDALLINIMKDAEPFYVEPAITAADMTQDQQLLIPLKLVRRSGFDDAVTIAFSGQPKNVEVPKVSFAKGKDTAVARFFFKDNVATGPATLLMYATAKVNYSRNPWRVERAKADVAAIVTKLAADQKVLADAKTTAAAGTKKTVELAAMQKTYETQLTAVTAEQSGLQKQLKAAINGKAEATKQLAALKEKLNAATANVKPESDDVDAALKAVTDAASGSCGRNKALDDTGRKDQRRVSTGCSENQAGGR